MGRIHRYGQRDDVHVYNLVAQNTREGAVLQTVLHKLDVMRDQMGSDRVYDVIDDWLEGVPLVNLMEKAIDSEDAGEARRETEEALSTASKERAEHLIALQKKSSLASRLETITLKDAAQATFDEDWEWMGSYSTWRAAMFVFLYPENILLPSLRTEKTPAFANLVKTLRSAGRVTPVQASAAARAYQEYFEDVCALELAWTLLAEVTWVGDDHGITSTSKRPRLFLFAQSPKSDKAYWCTRAASQASDTQTFWHEISALKSVNKLIAVYLSLCRD